MQNLLRKFPFTNQTLSRLLYPSIIKWNVNFIQTYGALKQSIPHFWVYLTASYDNSFDLNQSMDILRVELSDPNDISQVSNSHLYLPGLLILEL